jgi:hypothetical protein
MMNKLTLLTQHTFASALVVSSDLASALAEAPWCKSQEEPQLIIFRGERFGDESLMISSHYADHLEEHVPDYSVTPINAIVAYLNEKAMRLKAI